MIFIFCAFLILYLLSNKHENSIYCLILIFALFFNFIRYGLGADYFAYQYIYETLNVTSVYHLLTRQMDYEPLFKLLLSLFKNFNFSYHVVSVTITSVIFILQSFWIYRNSKRKVLSLLLYISMFYFVWTLSAIRQGIVLVVSLFLFFDKREYSIKTKIISIIILSLVHYSALFLFLILGFNQHEFDKKQIIRLVLFSLLISFLPLQRLLEFIPSSGLINKILYYFEPGLKFLKPGYIVRLFFSFLLVLFYDRANDKKKVNNILFGFSIYFILSFAPITAGRLSIYTYILIVITLPEIISNLESKKVGTIFVLLFVFVYFKKEFNTMLSQSGFKSTGIPVIFDKENYDFDKYDYYLLSKREESSKIKNEFLAELETKEHVGYKENLFNFVEWNPLINAYSIINENGDLSINYPMRGNPKLYNNVIKNDYEIGLLFSETRYIDAIGAGRSREELISYIFELEEKQIEYENPMEEEIEMNFSEFPLATQDLFSFENNIKDFNIYKVSKPFTYHILKIRYYYDTVYVYLKEDFTPLSELHFDSFDNFNETNTVLLSYHQNTLRVNKSGEIIWVK